MWVLSWVLRVRRGRGRRGDRGLMGSEGFMVALMEMVACRSLNWRGEKSLRGNLSQNGLRPCLLGMHHFVRGTKSVTVDREEEEGQKEEDAGAKESAVVVDADDAHEHAAVVAGAEGDAERMH